MCNIIVINRGQKEIETPRQFLEHFGFEAPVDLNYGPVEMDACLCQLDIEKALISHNIEFKKFWGDIYVGMLEGLTDED